jgi:hypothetical protein
MLRYCFSLLCIVLLLGAGSCTALKNHPLPDQPSKGDYELTLRISMIRGGSVQSSISALQSFNDWVWLGQDGESNLVQVKYRNITHEQWTHLLHGLHAIPGVQVVDTKIPHS